MDIINIRRSVRSYKVGSVISEEQLTLIIKAAMQAPSSKGQMPWEFLVINLKPTLLRLSNELPRCECLINAGAAILVVANLDVVSTPAYHQDLAAATQNMLLEATHLGLGSCWLSVYNTPRQAAITKHFALPEHIEPFALVAFGELTNPNDLRFINRFNEALIHNNRW